MRFLRFLIVLALLAAPSVGSAQRAYWTQSIDAQQNCIADGGGLCILDFVETGSAVNEITITNAATGNDPTIASSGEANIGLTLSSQGAGGVVTILGTLLDIPSAASPATTAEGHFVFDNAANLGSGNRDTLEYFNSVESVYLVYFTAADVPTNGQVVKFNTDGTMTWEDDNDTGGATAWDAIGDPAGNGTILFVDTAQFMDWNTPATTTTRDGMIFQTTHDASTDVLTQRSVVITRLASSGTATLEVLLAINNADTDGLVVDGIDISTAAGNMTNGINFTPTGTIATAIRLDDDQITNVFSTTAHGITELELDIIGDGLIEGDAGAGTSEIDPDSVNAVDIDETDSYTWSGASTFTTGTTSFQNGFTLTDEDAAGFGTANEWTMFYNDAAADQLLIVTTKVGAIAVTDPMIQILVGTTPTADQDVFGVAKGTQGTNTDLFIVDEDGDGEFSGTLTAVGDFACPDCIETGDITDDTILELDLDMTNEPTDNFCLTSDTASGGFTWVACAGGSTTTEIEINMDEMFLLIPVTAGPQAELLGTNFVEEVLSFDASADEEVFLRFPIDAGENDTDIVCTWRWQAVATSGGVTFCMDAAESADSGPTDPADLVTAVCTVVTVDATTTDLNETVHTLTATFNGGSVFYGRLYRDVSDAGDTMTGDAQLMTGSCAYTVNL